VAPTTFWEGKARETAYQSKNHKRNGGGGDSKICRNSLARAKEMINQGPKNNRERAQGKEENTGGGPPIKGGKKLLEIEKET